MIKLDFLIQFQIQQQKNKEKVNRKESNKFKSIKKLLEKNFMIKILKEEEDVEMVFLIFLMIRQRKRKK